MRLALPFAAAIALAFTGGCVAPCCPSSVGDLRDEPMAAAYWAVDNLLAQLPENECVGRIMVATLVDINSVTQTSMFGRQVSEYLSARFTQRDIDVMHVTVRQDHILIRDEGQFLLSREVRNLAADRNAKTVLVGTYGTTSKSVRMSLKLVSTVDDSTLAAVDFNLNNSGDAAEMLGKRRF